MQLPPTNSPINAGTAVDEHCRLLTAPSQGLGHTCPNCGDAHVAAWPDLSPITQGRKFDMDQLPERLITALLVWFFTTNKRVREPGVIGSFFRWVFSVLAANARSIFEIV
jgi:hypothetical protein